MESPRVIVLGDFNIHPKTEENKLALDFLAAVSTLGLLQAILAPMLGGGGGEDMLDLIFCSEQGHLQVGDIVIKLCH